MLTKASEHVLQPELSSMLLWLLHYLHQLLNWLLKWQLLVLTCLCHSASSAPCHSPCTLPCPLSLGALLIPQFLLSAYSGFMSPLHLSHLRLSSTLARPLPPDIPDEKERAVPCLCSGRKRHQTDLGGAKLPPASVTNAVCTTQSLKACTHLLL